MRLESSDGDDIVFRLDAVDPSSGMRWRCVEQRDRNLAFFLRRSLRRLVETGSGLPYRA